MNFNPTNKLRTLAAKYSTSHQLEYPAFQEGFREAFKIIGENLAAELNRLEEFQPHGERLMTLKLYKSKIQNILVEMEKNYE